MPMNIDNYCDDEHVYVVFRKKKTTLGEDYVFATGMGFVYREDIMPKMIPYKFLIEDAQKKAKIFSKDEILKMVDERVDEKLKTLLPQAKQNTARAVEKQDSERPNSVIKPIPRRVEAAAARVSGQSALKRVLRQAQEEFDRIEAEKEEMAATLEDYERGRRVVPKEPKWPRRSAACERLFDDSHETKSERVMELRSLYMQYESLNRTLVYQHQQKLKQFHDECEKYDADKAERAAKLAEIERDCRAALEEEARRNAAEKIVPENSGADTPLDRWRGMENSRREAVAHEQSLKLIEFVKAHIVADEDVKSSNSSESTDSTQSDSDLDGTDQDIDTEDEMPVLESVGEPEVDEEPPIVITVELEEKAPEVVEKPLRPMSEKTKEILRKRYGTDDLQKIGEMRYKQSRSAE